MKKTVSILLALILISFTAVTAFAARLDNIAPPAISSVTADTANNDILFTVAHTAALSDVEGARLTVLRTLLTEYTVPEIAASDYAYILYETKIFCEISSDGKNFVNTGTFASECNTVSLSLASDILPALGKISDLSETVSGFTLYIRLRIASDNYNYKNAADCFVCTEASQAKKYNVPPFSLADYDLGGTNADNKGNPVVSFGGFETDIKLTNPTRTGYIFAGWQDGNGEFVNTVPAGTKYIRLKANWEPRSYKINYVVTLGITSYLGRVDISTLPAKYTVGVNTPLEEPKISTAAYCFDGWFLTPDLSGAKLTAIPADRVGDITVYAKWITATEKDKNEADNRNAQLLAKGYGDVNYDGKITAADARLVLRAVVGLEAFTQDQKKRADIFGTNIITASNSRSLLRIAVGLDDLYSVMHEYDEKDK